MQANSGPKDSQRERKNEEVKNSGRIQGGCGKRTNKKTCSLDNRHKHKDYAHTFVDRNSFSNAIWLENRNSENQIMYGNVFSTIFPTLFHHSSTYSLPLYFSHILSFCGHIMLGAFIARM